MIVPNPTSPNQALERTAPGDKGTGQLSPLIGAAGWQGDRRQGGSRSRVAVISGAVFVANRGRVLWQPAAG
jgi:hypothetical protein